MHTELEELVALETLTYVLEKIFVNHLYMIVPVRSIRCYNFEVQLDISVIIERHLVIIA